MHNADGKTVVAIDLQLLPVVPGYLESRRRDCMVINSLLVSGSMEGIGFLGHQLKGSGGSFGFDELSDIGEALECAARKLDADRVSSAVKRLERFLASVSVEYI